MKLAPQHRKTIAAYDLTQQRIDRLQIYLLKQHIRQGFTTSIVENSERKFIDMYFKSSDKFKTQGSYYIILLEAEDIGKEIIAELEKERQAHIDDDGIQEEEIRFKKIEESIIKAVPKLQDVLRQLAENSKKIKDLSEFSRLSNIAAHIKLNGENEFLQIIELLKFNVAKVLFYECEIRQHELSVYQ